MRIVILGYTGLIGNSILEYLFENTSFAIICVGRNTKIKPFKNKRIKYFKWNFKSFKKTNKFNFNKEDIIINCVGKINDDKYKTNNINVIFLKKLLQHINSNKIKVRIIHLSSVAVYGGSNIKIGKNKVFTEQSKERANDIYSRSKIEGDSLIQNVIKKGLNKNFSYTIFRISNVFGGAQKSNLFKYVIFTLKNGLWIKCYDDITFNFVNINDVVQAIILSITKLNVSKNKTYIVSDDCKQKQIYNKYKIISKRSFFKVQIPIQLLKFLIFLFPFPKKIFNFFSIISCRISYSNKKIKKELKFKPMFSLYKKIKLLNGQKN